MSSTKNIISVIEIKDTVTDGTFRLKCKFYTPPVLDTPRPLLIFLHGIGEVGSNPELVLKYGPLKLLRDGVDIRQAKNAIIVHPQNPGSIWTIGEIDEVLEYMARNFPVDRDQIWLAGASLGGFGVWTYASSPEHVKKLAAIVPICGGGNDPSRAQVLVDEGIPGWAAHAASDTVVKQEVTLRMVEAVNGLANREQIRFSEYGMSGHGAWNYFLKPEYGLYDWLYFQRKSNRIPKSIPVVPAQNSVRHEINIVTGDEIVIKVR